MFIYFPLCFPNRFAEPGVPLFSLRFLVVVFCCALSWCLAAKPDPVLQLRAPSPVPPKYSLAKTSDPSSAVVSFAFTNGAGNLTVDGYKVCNKQVRCSGEIPKGLHTVVLSREGYLDSSFRIMIPNGNNFYATSLIEKPGILSVHAQDEKTGKPVMAIVMVDDRAMGQTPWTGPLSREVKRVGVRAPGYMEANVAERPLPGKDQILAIKLSLTETKGMAKVSAGCFEMGEESGKPSERPAHEVCLNAFFMDKYEFTQGQYQKLADGDPSYFANCGTDCPVESIQWKQAKNLCEKLGKRLPTEAEWEYSARAGSTYKWGCGIVSLCVSGTGWTGSNSGKRTHPVGQKPANSFGLYDMAGNVSEWTADWYGEEYYAFSPKQNPKGANRGQGRAVRGGSWDEKGDALKPSGRSGYEPDFRESTVGFRCAMDLPGAKN